MPKKRNKENNGWPKGWRLKCGAIRYRVPAGCEHLWDGKKEFTLGKTEAEAYKVWADRLELQKDAVTIADLMDRYSQQVVPTKAPRTQESSYISLKRLKKVFGGMLIPDLKPVDVYGYLDLRADHPTSANRDIEVLSHTYTMAIRWGLTEYHPIIGKVKKHSEKSRDRYVEDWELLEAVTVASPMIRAYISIKVLTGLRRADILTLKVVDIKEDGIHVQPRKTAKTTGKKLIIEITETLQAAIDEARRVRPKDIAPWLFCTGKGKCYLNEYGKANGFDSIWARFMTKALAETGLTERFQERDLRAKTASDMPLDLASALLGHADKKITQAVYRRKPDVVRPLK